MFGFVFKSFSGAYHNKNFNNSVNAAQCVFACVHIYGTFNFYIKNTLKSTLKNQFFTNQSSRLLPKNSHLAFSHVKIKIS
jgi:hypothetical protein